MNIVKNINQYSEDNVFFSEPIKNNIVNDACFIRINYSTQRMTLNGVFLLIPLIDCTYDKYFNKYRCVFDLDTNIDIIYKLKNIEEGILNKINIFNKSATYKIYEQLKAGSIKTYDEFIKKPDCSFILKISGVWETQFNYGLTYKFIHTN
jgi:hypothetical protein